MAKRRENSRPPRCPPTFLDRMRTLLGAEFDAFAAVYDRPAVQGLRVNTLKIATAELLRHAPPQNKPGSLVF